MKTKIRTIRQVYNVYKMCGMFVSIKGVHGE